MINPKPVCIKVQVNSPNNPSYKRTEQLNMLDSLSSLPAKLFSKDFPMKSKSTTFTVRSLKQVDFRELQESTTRVNPVVLVKGKKRSWIMFHDSLKNKAYYVGLEDKYLKLSDKYEDDLGLVLNENIPKFIKWARKVKAAPWPKAEKQTFEFQDINL